MNKAEKQKKIQILHDNISKAIEKYDDIYITSPVTEKYKLSGRRKNIVNFHISYKGEKDENIIQKIRVGIDLNRVEYGLRDLKGNFDENNVSLEAYFSRCLMLRIS